MENKELFGKKSPNEIKKDSNGDILVCIGNHTWIRQKDIPSKNEVREEFKRYNHPIIYKSEILLNIFSSALFLIIIVFFTVYFFDRKPFSFYLLEFFVLLLIYVLFSLKKIVIFFIKIYQIKAPMNIRLRCHLTPTCSDYSILAIKKYGLIIGLIKSIKRLKNCKGQSGKDYP